MKINKFRGALYIASWIPVGIVNIVLWILGVPIVAWYARDAMDTWPRWTWIWQNDGDASDPKLGASGHDVPWWYYKKYGPEGEGWSPWRLRFAYMAIRNPVNNHRFLFEDVTSWRVSGDARAFDTEGSDLVRLGIHSAAGWRYTGWIAGFKRTWLNSSSKYSEFYIGWKVGSGVPGLGFTFQLRLKRDFISPV